ncbi:hypothetical protein ASE78_05890 [Sphingomonas sp. Leaf25]|nr:hypothetical protein ASE78_05890 [Sphingomonas sp. Leaf25]
MANNSHNYSYSDRATIRNGHPTEAERKSILPGSMAFSAIEPAPPAQMPTSRRALLMGMVALPLAACPAPVPAAGAAPAVSDPEWDRLYAAYRAAQVEEVERLAVFAPLDDAWGPGSALCEPEPTRPTIAPYDMSLPIGEAIAVAAGPDWEARWEAYEADKAAWKARDDAAYAAHVGDTGDRYEAACDACSAAVTALMGHPVATLSALAEKAELILTRYGDTVDGDDAKTLIADIRRLAAGEA